MVWKINDSILRYGKISFINILPPPYSIWIINFYNLELTWGNKCAVLPIRCQSTSNPKPSTTKKIKNPNTSNPKYPQKPASMSNRKNNNCRNINWKIKMPKGENHIHPTLYPSPTLSTRDNGSMGNLMASVNCSLPMDPISMALLLMALFKAKEDLSPILDPIMKDKSGTM